MLVVTRKPGDSVVIPSLNISVVVLSVAGDKVRIGVEAPKHVKILRKELIARAKITKDKSERRMDRDEVLELHAQRPQNTFNEVASTVSRTGSRKASESER